MAKQVCDEFIVYSHPDPIEFTGKNNIVINSEGHDLFSQSGFQKDFEISFDILSLNLSGSPKQATLLSVKNEDLNNKWPWVSFRRETTSSNLELTIRWWSVWAVTRSYIWSDVHSVKISRENGKLYIAINGWNKEKVYDFAGFTDYFDKPITIGSIYQNWGYDRYIKATLSNILIKTIDTNSCYTWDVLAVTWDCQMTAVFTSSGSCTYGGEIYENWSVLTWYQSDSVTCPNSCVSQVATCNNGEWSVNNFSTEYSHSSCSYSGFSCDAGEYPLSSCPDNWICSSCTGYSVSENACNQLSPIYRLESCSGHYHVSGDVCELDTYTITWKNDDWTTIDTTQVWYGEMPVHTSGTKANTEEYTYIFLWWNPELTWVTEATTYTAVYNSIINVYTATIVASPEWYGTVDSGSVVAEYGTSISTNWNELTIWLTTILATPAETWAQYTYAFNGWTFSNCGSEWNYEIGPNCEITANFERTTNEYTVTIVSSDINSWTVTTWSITVLYWTSISKSGNIVTIWSETSTANANPQTWQYDFDFVDWTDTCGATVTTWCEITANFDSSLRSYTLDLVVGTWIELIYYKVNWEDNFISTWVSAIISGVEAWSMIYAYAEPKNWYIYTDTSVDNPWSVLVTWNNIFSPEATSDSVQYVVYHYVKRVWENTYALTDTETRYGTADTIVSISSLARAEDFPCASLSGVRWSLTWTESWPWEIVTWAMIEWDGLTQIHIYYVRNYHEISLTGDSHVASLTWDGVRECGSDRPIGATPKPWYHFVRWEEREKEEKEDEDINWW